MYIINNKGEIFNTDCTSWITSDNAYVFAVFGNTTRTISYNPGALKTITEALKAGADYVEVD